MTFCDRFSYVLSSRRTILFLICLFSSVPYLNTLPNDFIYDDRIILEYPLIHQIGFIPDSFLSHGLSFQFPQATSNYYNPLKFVADMVLYRLFADNPIGYHLTNLIVHLITSVMVFYTASTLFKQAFNEDRLFFPAAAALLFAVHPIHTEAVAWISAKGDLFMSLFCLMSFYVYINTSEEKGRRFVVSAALFFAAALFKATAITLFLLLIVYDYDFKKGPFSSMAGKAQVLPCLLKRYLPFALAALLYLSMRTYAIKGFIPTKGYPDFDLITIIINVFPLLGDYLTMLVLPINLSIHHVFHPVFSLMDVRTIPGLCVVTVFTAFVMLARKRTGLLLALLWIIIPLLPVLYFPAFASEAVLAERYLYLPSVGFVIAVGILVRDVYQARLLKAMTFPATCLGVTLLLISFALQTVNRNSVWKNDYSLWTDALKGSPDSAVVHYNVGNAYYRRGSLEDAIREYTTALSLAPDFSEARQNLSIAHAMKTSLAATPRRK